MKNSDKKGMGLCDHHVMGTAVLGERGQLVIPKEVRDCYNIKAGDKFIVMGHGQGPIAFIPVNQMKDFIEDINNKMEGMLKE